MMKIVGIVYWIQSEESVSSHGFQTQLKGQILSDCYGIDTTDDCRPSIQGKAVPTETYKTSKPYMNSGI